MAVAVGGMTMPKDEKPVPLIVLDARRMRKETLEEMLRKTPPPEAGYVYHVNIYHDGWCDIYKGRVCNCSPDVEYVRKERL